jgi:hypothetical protein
MIIPSRKRIHRIFPLWTPLRDLLDIFSPSFSISFSDEHSVEVGDNTIGRGSERSISFDSANAAEDLGTLTLTDANVVTYSPPLSPSAEKVKVDGKEVDAAALVSVVTDEKGATPTYFRFSSLLWFVIKRGLLLLLPFERTYSLSLRLSSTFPLRGFILHPCQGSRELCVEKLSV